METKMMKKSRISLRKWALGICMLFAGVQSAWSMACEGTIYIKIPKTWSAATAVINMDGDALSFPATAQNGWYVFDAATLGKEYSKEFIIMQKSNGWNDGGITTKHYGVSGGDGGWSQADKFSCTDISATGMLYIYEDPTTAGKTAYTSAPPNAKYLYMMVPPDFTDWMSSVPMISTDGGLTGKMLKADPDKCGWYYYVWFGEEISNSVVFYREDAEIDPDTGVRDDMLGLNGNWEEGDAVTPITLKDFFNEADTLYFVPDESQHLGGDDDIGWYTTFPEGVEGVCEYTLAALIYDTDASLHGAFTCNPDWVDGQTPAQAHVNKCFSASAQFNVVASAAAEVPCIGVTTGMVTDLLDHVKGSPTYKKPRLTTKGQACFGATPDAAFTAMFTSNPTVNETYCVDMPFHKSSDNKWEFDSDTYTGPETSPYPVPGGFYPAETTPPVDRFVSPALPAAETKRKAEGPVFMCQGFRNLHPTEGAPYSDLICNGPGWDGGINCEGWYAGGSEFNSTTFPGFATATELKGLTLKGDGWGWGCPEDAPIGWTFYTKGTEVVVGTKINKNEGPKDPVTGKDVSGDSRWTSGASDATALISAGRNQHFCFESHAKFTHKPGLRFSFRGDDDIWVYIDNKLAVDLGGTHLAAPGYVNLDTFIGENGKLTPGEEYDLDIFFCDRRTTMSNVRIKTNMYIRQKSDIEVTRDSKVAAGKGYDICYSKSSDGSCAAAISGGGDETQKFCGDTILTNGIDISYWLVQGKTIADSVNRGSQKITYDNGAGAKLHNCIIDLSNFTKPVIGNADDVCGLGLGRYTLFVKIESKSRQVATFRPKGDVDVVYRNGIAVDTADKPLPNGKYNVIDMAMAGELVPVYISNVREPDNSSDPLNILPQDASNVPYSLVPDEGLQICFVPTRNADGVIDGCAEWLNAVNGNRTIGSTGIDTVYAYVSQNDLTESQKVFQVGVKGKANKVSITFFLPVIMFIKNIPPSDTILPVAMTGDTLQEDGTYEERWVGSVFDLYLAIFRPDGKGGMMLCPECNLEIQTGETSPQITFSNTKFENGYATISVISTKEYRYDSDTLKFPPAQIEVTNALGTVSRIYRPIYFREPPVPSPRLADVFDVRGSKPEVELKIPDPYYNKNVEYLDGIADSVAVYYHRAFHEDSLPSRICIAWDTASALKYNPYKGTYTDKDGKEISVNGKDAQPAPFSTISRDDLIYCNALVSVDKNNINCEGASLNGGYCTNVVKIAGLTLSEKAKTAGTGRVISYAAFKDKGKEIMQGFPGTLIDRVAPVPLRAEVRAIKKGDGELSDYDSLVVVMSEPVRLLTLDYKKNALDFYLNSAVDLSEENRFVSVLGSTVAVVSGAQDPVVGVGANNEGRIKYQYIRGSISPHVGDFVRLTGDLTNVFWSDDADISNPYDSLRNTAEDLVYNWNSPTSYNETKRLPSPWVLVSGEPEVKVIENNFASTANSPVGEKVPVVTVNGYSTNLSKDEVLAAEGGRLGLFAQADMYSLINDMKAKDFKDEDLDPAKIYFSYDIKIYTNLGNYVAGQSGKIYCDDSKNTQVDLDGKKIEFFGGSKTCLDAGIGYNFFIGWNTRSDKGRMVGTGAYIVKYQTFIKLDKAGKYGKNEKTSVWGVKRSPIPNTEYLKNAAK